MEELIEYLNTGNCIAFIGAGPSCEIKIPDWKGLAQNVYARLERRPDQDFSEIDQYFKVEKWPEFFGAIKRLFGIDHLYNLCFNQIKDTGNIGVVYTFLSKFPFQAYFTTNFDDALQRHLNKQGISPSLFLNRKKDFEQLDIDTFKKCIVKIHGDFSDKETLVLTDEQYEKREVGDEYEYYRSELSSYFNLKRILFIGYSIDDPDIQILLKRIAINIRRKIPLYAIIADAKTTTIREWDRKYNIQVISYHNYSKTHKELVGLFEAIDRYIGIDGTPPPVRSDVDLKRAQSFYMWHRFLLGDQNIGVQVDALKSIVISTIQKSFTLGSTFSGQQIAEIIDRTFSIPINNAIVCINACLQALTNEGFLQYDDNSKYSLTKELIDLQEKYDGQYARMQSNFDEQVALSFRIALPEIGEKQIDQIVKTVSNVIVDLFIERGTEILDMIFSKREISMVQATNLFRLINRRAQDISNRDLRYRFITYVTNMLAKPTSIQENILEYYSNAFFTMQALALDPHGQKFREEFLKNRTIIIDSTVLIPLLAKYSSNQEIFDKVLIAAKLVGINLITTENLVLEVKTHIEWAQKFIQRWGEQSDEVMSAALGRPPYRRNAFLDGYIRYCADIKSISFSSYLNLLFGDEVTEKLISDTLKNNYGIELFEISKIFNKSNESTFARDSLVTYVLEKADEADIEKNQLRAKCEAEAYVIIKYWDLIKTDKSNEEWQCSFLSQGGFLNRIAKESNFPINKNIVIRIDALYEFLLRFGTVQRKQISFKDILLSTYFRSAEYFIDKTKYRRYFSSLINEAERAYKEGLEEFKKYVNENLTTGSMDQFSDFEKPLFLAGLQQKLKEVLSDQKTKISILEDTVARKEKSIKKITADLAKYQEKEARMKKYADKQRRYNKKKGRNR